MPKLHFQALKVCSQKISLFVILMMTSVCVYANGDPVARFSSILRAANPVPRSIAEISIVKEKIKIVHVDGYNCFDITYTFKNSSGKNFRDIDYGFPIDYLIEDEQETYKFTTDDISESIEEIGWNDRLIKDISFTFNGEELPFHSAKESVREAGLEVDAYGDETDSIYVDGINRRWFYTKFSMNSLDEATFNVKYKVYANSTVGLYSADNYYSYYTRREENMEFPALDMPFPYRYFDHRFEILYDFTPAKYFGKDSQFPIYIDIDLGNLTNAYVKNDNEEGNYSYYVNRITRYDYFHYQKDIKPIALTVSFEPDCSEMNVNRIIDKLCIPKSEFDVSKKSNTLKIDLHRPMFVSDVACYMDTTGVKAINSVVTFSDGRQKRYIYEPGDMKGMLVDMRIKFPILLTITDLHSDGFIWTENKIEPGAQDSEYGSVSYNLEIVSQEKGFDDEKFKIKSIELTFDSKKSAKSICKNIKVLDARFIKP